MDVLIALGSSVAYFYSIAILVLPGLGGHVYFETSAVIITLIKFGITSQFQFMYSFGIPISSLNKVSLGSHEFTLKYNFIFKKPNVANPRFLGW